MSSVLVQSEQKVSIEALTPVDFDLIEDMPWAQTLWNVLEDHTKKGFLNWCKIVKNLAGTRDDNIQEWCKVYSESIDEVLCDMVAELNRVNTTTVKKIQELFKQLKKVCLELHEPVPQELGSQGLCLYDEQEQLRKHIQKYEEVLNAKKAEVDNLIKKQQHLCKYLGVEPKLNLQYPPLPTPRQLEELQNQIQEMEVEKFEREEKYFHLKENIMKLVKELNYKPTGDFERKVLLSDNLFVTTENMEKLEFFAKSLKEIRETTKEEISHLRTRIEDLWKMLDVDLIDRDEFRTHYTGNSLDTLDALRVEVKRCEEMRKANIQNFVEKLRAELQDLWTKCHCSETEKRYFKYFNDDCYTEDLLDIHELEIQKWKTYYQRNCRILGLLEKYKQLWEKAFELEDKAATGANRYKNRGGNLLQEEKERNKLSKLIPKIEEEILALSDEYREYSGGTPFLSFGRTPEECIKYFHDQREHIKKLKLSAKKQREVTLRQTPGKSALTLFPSTSTAVTPTTISSTKRKILATPNTDVKRLRVNTPRVPIIKPKANTGTVPKIKVTHSTKPLPSQKRRSRTSLEKHKSRRSNMKSGHAAGGTTDENDTINTTYTTFQNELSSREQCRSTILPDPLSKTPLASSPKKRRAPRTLQNRTPARTPLKVKTPQSRTPNNSTSKNPAKLSACKSGLKLLF